MRFRGENMMTRKVTMPTLETYQYQNEKLSVSKSNDILPNLRIDSKSLNSYTSTLSAIKKVQFKEPSKNLKIMQSLKTAKLKILTRTDKEPKLHRSSQSLGQLKKLPTDISNPYSDYSNQNYMMKKSRSRNSSLE